MSTTNYVPVVKSRGRLVNNCQVCGPMDSPQPEYTALFRYLRMLVDTEQKSLDPNPQFALVEAYWHIGRIVVETEQDGQERADYGIHLIEILSQRLTQEFGKGYSLPNMWRFKQFYLAFPILSTNGRELPNLRNYLRTELRWSHYRILMQLENKQERAFYIQQAADERWPVRILQRLVNSRYYYQTALGEDHLLAGVKKIATLAPAGLSPTQVGSNAPQPLRTRLANIRKTLLEQYVGYAFVAQRQYVSVLGHDRWAELVFFQYVLNRFILVQLSEHDPASVAQFRQLLDAYLDKQPPTVSQPPVGFLVDPTGRVKVITSSQEPVLPTDEETSLPRFFH